MPDRLSNVFDITLSSAAIFVRIHRRSSPRGSAEGLLKGEGRRITAFGRVEVNPFVPLFLEAFDIHPEPNHRLNFSWPFVGVSGYSGRSVAAAAQFERLRCVCLVERRMSWE